MNNIFDIKRFGNYFLYDLRRAKNNYGLSLLLLGLIPVILFVAYVLLSLIGLLFNSHANGIGMMPDGMKFAAVFTTIFVVILGAGAKIYGFVTEKRAGSDFLMLPASTLEKWLSMVLVVCVVLPVILFALQFVSDGLLALIFPNTYGSSLASFIDQDFIDGISAGLMEEEGLYINFPAMMFLSWCQNVLAFTLGAVCFKRGKVGKTILCLFGLGILFSTLMVLLVGNTSIDTDRFVSFFDSPEKAFSAANWLINIFYIIVIGGLLGGLYYRLRTIKQ